MDEAKMKECLEKIQAILKEYDCAIQVNHGLVVVPKEEVK